MMRAARCCAGARTCGWLSRRQRLLLPRPARSSWLYCCGRGGFRSARPRPASTASTAARRRRLRAPARRRPARGERRQRRPRRRRRACSGQAQRVAVPSRRAMGHGQPSGQSRARVRDVVSSSRAWLSVGRRARLQSLGRLIIRQRRVRVDLERAHLRPQPPQQHQRRQRDEVDSTKNVRPADRLREHAGQRPDPDPADRRERAAAARTGSR